MTELSECLDIKNTFVISSTPIIPEKPVIIVNGLLNFSEKKQRKLLELLLEQ